MSQEPSSVVAPPPLTPSTEPLTPFTLASSTTNKSLNSFAESVREARTARATVFEGEGSHRPLRSPNNAALSEKGARASPRGKQSNKAIHFPSASSVLASRATAMEEVSQLEAKVEESKTLLDSQLHILRTQITRIEELERLVETATAQLAASHRRRESELSDMDGQRRLLQAQLERQLADNRAAEAQFIAARAKNNEAGRVMRGQVVSLADTFSPTWAGKEVMDLVLATVRAEAAQADGTEGEVSPEAEAAAIQAVFDLRSRDERLSEVVKWKQQKDEAQLAAAAEREAAAAELARQEAEDAQAREYESKLAALRQTYFPEHIEKPPQSPVPPPRDATPPDARLRARYGRSAERSLHCNVAALH